MTTRRPPGTYFRCVVCGKLTAGRLPREGRHHPGDGSVMFPRRHSTHGYPCPGNVRLATWVEVDEDGEQRARAWEEELSRPRPC